MGSALDGAMEILELELPAYESVVEQPKDGSHLVLDQSWRAASVRMDIDVNSFAFVGDAQDVNALNAAYQEKFERERRARKKAPPAYDPPKPPPVRVWIRRQPSKEPPHGVLYVASIGAQPGHRIPFHVEAMPASARNPKRDVERTKNWAAAAARYFANTPGAFYTFASQRIGARYLARQNAAKPARARDLPRDLARLMETTSGRRSLQEALEHERPLYLAASRSQATIPIERVEPPRLGRHPWNEMLQALRRPTRDEPLARATPAEFYFARVKTFAKFLELLDWISEWGQPAADLLDSHAEDRATVQRYEDELGLERSGLSRVLGPSVIEDVAVVGSDPYVHEGSDVTLIFRVKSVPAFETGLAAALNSRSHGHGELKQTTFEHEGVKVNVSRSADGRVRRHRASVGGYELVSNSPNALRRVITTIQGRHPSLANEPDFRYMLAREGDVENDALAYVGDSFVAAVTGPKQKIAEARRQIALAELSAPGYAALLAGWLDGNVPSSQAALLQSGWLEKSELRHGDGAPIAFEPSVGASSAHGAPAALEPLIDRPEVVKVRPEEQQAYTSFANSYSALWSDRIDPIALSVRLAASSGERELSAELRVLPLLRREYRDWISLVGDARLSVPTHENGLRIVAGIGKQARLRGLLDDFGRDFIRNEKVRFDWLGDYVILGAANRNELANAALRSVRHALERPRPQQEYASDLMLESRMLVGLPVYAVIALKSPLAAGVALTALRQRASEAAPGMAEWGEAAKYRGQAVVKVTVREMGEMLEIYYSLLPTAFTISLNEAALHEAIDQVLDHPPSAEQAKPTSRAAQVSFEIGGDKHSPLYRIAAWFAQAELLDRRGQNPALVEAVLRGAPETQKSPDRLRVLLRNYFGSVPLTPDGRYYESSPEGPRDPVRGSAYAPTYPDVPVPGSPLERVLAGLRYARSEQSYDAEPGDSASEPRQSLRVKVTLKMRNEKR